MSAMSGVHAEVTGELLQLILSFYLYVSSRDEFRVQACASSTFIC